MTVRGAVMGMDDESKAAVRAALEKHLPHIADKAKAERASSAREWLDGMLAEGERERERRKDTFAEALQEALRKNRGES